MCVLSRFCIFVIKKGIQLIDQTPRLGAGGAIDFVEDMKILFNHLDMQEITKIKKRNYDRKKGC
jgi:hypothetical protein